MISTDGGQQSAAHAPGIARRDPLRPAPAGRSALLALLGILVASAGLLLLVLARGSVESEVPVQPAAPIASLDRPPMPSVEGVVSERVAVLPRRASVPRSDAQSTRAVPPQEPLDARGPRTEGEYLAELRALARSDPAAFGRRVESILAGSGPACEQFASLRAAYEENWAGTTDLCVRAVTVLSHASGPQAESVPQALVHWLGQQAPLESRARDALAAIVWDTPASLDPTLRGRALRLLVLSSPEADLPLLARRIHAEGDPDLHSAGRSALDQRDRPLAHPDSFQEFP
ncbi:MAG: hypothetical protein NTY35_02845 [Planctomycetota bacterium]|nr:hypothetical protein [Planctomycetota bacterium]